MKLVERKLCSNIDEARAVDDEIKDGGKRIAFDLFLEITIPQNRTTGSKCDKEVIVLK